MFNYNLNLGNDRIVADGKTVGTGIDYSNSALSKIKNSTNELSLQYKTKLDTIGRTLDITAYSNFFNRKPNTASLGENNGNPAFYNGKIDFNLVNYYVKYDFAIPFKKLDFSL